MNQTLTTVLSAPIDPSRVATRDGRSYLEGWDVIATLNRIFGFDGWSKDVQALELCFETSETKPGRNGGSYMAWTVAYRARVILTIKDEVSSYHADVAVGSAINQPSRADAHDLAIKSAVTDALKRCAKDLGDQFGLSLYNKGSLAATHSRSEPPQTRPQAPRLAQPPAEANGAPVQPSLGKTAGYRQANPAIADWLDRHAADGNFATSLLQGLRNYGHLTENQEAAVKKALSKKADEQRDTDPRRYDGTPG